jgi:signal transduction histidine kinase/GAF domain-containing protein
MVDVRRDAEPETAAQVATRAARMVAEAARVAEREERTAQFTRMIAKIATAVARELSLSALVEVLLEQAVDALGASYALMHLADEAKRRLDLFGHRQMPASLMADLVGPSFDSPLYVSRAAATRRTQTVSSAEEIEPSQSVARKLLAWAGCESLVALPLVARGHLLGVWSVVFRERRTVGPEEVAAFEACAEVVGFGMANAMAYEKEHRTRSLFEAVDKAALAVANELDLRAVLQNIVDGARAITDAEYAALGIVKSPDQPFEPWVFSGMTKEQEASIGPHPRPVGALGAVALGGLKIRTADLHGHPAFRGFPEAHPRMTSFLGVPVPYQGRTVGNIYLTNKRGAPEFTLEDQRAIELLSAHAGAAVHQASLRQQLEAEKARSAAIVENAPYAVVFVEAGTERLTLNRRAQELAAPNEKRTLADVQGELCTPDGTPIPPSDWPPRRVMRGESVGTQEILLRLADGRDIPVLLSAAPVPRADGSGLEGVVLIYEDISRLKELERLRDAWAALVTHDLRQPLNVVTNGVSILQRLAEDPDPRGRLKVLERTQRATGSLDRMISDLADASRIEAKCLTLERRPVDLRSIARDVVDRQREMNPDRAVALEADDPVPMVAADPMRIEQVLGNLVANALKYADPGAPVSVEVRRADGEARVLVTNRGPGIPAEQLPRLFERYFRTPSARAGAVSGSGLGLYIAKGLVDAHGGRIGVESRPGETTTFHFTLPVAREGE